MGCPHGVNRVGLTANAVLPVSAQQQTRVVIDDVAVPRQTFASRPQGGCSRTLPDLCLRLLHKQSSVAIPLKLFCGAVR